MRTSTTAYFDHEADTGIIGSGRTLEQAFESAAAAMFGLMAELGEVRPLRHISFSFTESDAEYALVTWLNQLLSEARIRGLVFSAFRLSRSGSHWRGDAWGEPWRDGLDRGVEVKGATLTMLSVRSTPAGWEARCVVDV